MPMFAGELHTTMGQIVGAYALDEQDFYNVMDFVSELFVEVFEAVDFNRVILEASGMCTEKQEADPNHKPTVRSRYKHDSLIEEHNPDFNLGVEFCADCFRLCILRMEKWRVMEQADVAKTLPEDHAPKGWKLPGQLAEELAAWLRNRKESWK